MRRNKLRNHGALILSLVPVLGCSQALGSIISTSPDVAYVCKEESVDAETMKETFQGRILHDDWISRLPYNTGIPRHPVRTARDRVAC